MSEVCLRSLPGTIFYLWQLSSRPPCSQGHLADPDSVLKASTSACTFCLPASPETTPFWSFMLCINRGVKSISCFLSLDRDPAPATGFWRHWGKALSAAPGELSQSGKLRKFFGNHIVPAPELFLFPVHLSPVISTCPVPLLCFRVCEARIWGLHTHYLMWEP